MKVLAFGIVKEIFGKQIIDSDTEPGITVHALKYSLEKKYPKLGQLGSYMVAVNSEYAQDNDLLDARDEIAIIPPVSGG